MTGTPSFLLGLIGAGIQASLSPALHEREAADQGMRLVYRVIDLNALGLDVAALPDGLNITFPAKQAVLPLLHALSDDARALGAVNTVVLRDGQRIGHNTDLSGYAANFRAGLADAPRGRVVQMGAGGAGSAVAHAAMRLGVGHLTIVDVDGARASRLAAALCALHGAGRATAASDPAEAIAAADGLINTTPVGMAKFPGAPLPLTLLRPSLWVSEIVYFPIETALLAAARALGCRTLDGGGMVVAQAADAFRLFTGGTADTPRMLAHFATLRNAAA
jgi:shikimate dehydrogenase